MPSYKETIGEQLKRARLGPTFVRRGMLPKCAPKPMRPRDEVAIAEGPIIGAGNTGSIQPPAEVLLERDRRLSLAPRSLTAALQGDPEPGRRWQIGRAHV